MSKNTITAILRRRDGRGQALPLFALMLPVLLAFMALGMDASRMYAERRDAQGAADLAALAGLDKLPDQVSATAEALAVTSANGYAEAEVTVTFPQANRIRVVVREEMNTFFAPILTSFFDAGRDWDTVAVEALAEAVKQQGATGEYAVIGLKEQCDIKGGGGSETVDWGGGSHELNGGVHSNSGLKFHGGGNAVDGPITYGCEGEYFNKGNNPDIPPQADPEKCGETELGNGAPCWLGSNWPMPDPLGGVKWDTYPASLGGCTFSSSANNWTLKNDNSVWVDKNNGILKPGLYCNASGTITVSGSNVGIALPEGSDQGVTFWAREVKLAGSGDKLFPYDTDNMILAFASAPEDNDLSKKPEDRIKTGIEFSGANLEMEGLMYAPKGLVKNTGANPKGGVRLLGGIIGYTVDLAGSGMTVTGLMEQQLMPPYVGLVR